jgi:hypothetical protein
MCRSSGGSTRGAASRRRAAGWVLTRFHMLRTLGAEQGRGAAAMSTSQQTKTASPARGTFDN